MKNKNVCVILIGMLVACLIFFFSAALAERPDPEILLYTYYLQMGWGDRMQIGCLDGKGNVWLLTGYQSSLKWPYGEEEQLEYLRNCEALELKGTLDSDSRFAVKSLIAGTDAQGVRIRPAANDAGTESSYAVKVSGGKEEAILLGMSGDDVFENTDPDAQALYQQLRMLFPEVMAYSGGMGPAGFSPVPVASFCGINTEGIENGKIVSVRTDCEEGFVEVETDDRTKKELLRLVKSGRVVGKANAIEVTGDIMQYSFYDRNGSFLGRLDVYEGLIVGADGMYYASTAR